MAKGTILIIEDNQEFRKIYGDRLTFDGFDVLEADDGIKGLEVARSRDISVVITDINMPNMDGIELIREMKADEKLQHIPILVMSVFDTSDYYNKAKELGAAGYIVKGTETPNDVAKKVEELVPAA